MITTKRQITRDRDRFGGYGTASDRSPLIDDDVNIMQNNETSSDLQSDYGVMTDSIVMPTLQNNTVSDWNTAENAQTSAQTEKPLYSTLDSYGQDQPRAQFDLPTRPVRERKPLEHEDIMPSIKTRAYTQPVRHTEAEAAPRRSAHRALSPRTKVLLLVYVAVALVLAIAVIATGVSISGAQASVRELSEHISQQQATVAEQVTDIASLTDEAHIRDRAVANGMVNSSEPTYTASRVETVEVQEATPHTNGFDGFCDWMSGVVM